MSLVRWSTSCWYIYEPCGTAWTLKVCLFGQFNVVDILRNYSKIESKAKKDGYSFFQRLELRAYLKLWALWRMKKVTYKQYVKLLNIIRDYGHTKRYIEDPWDFENVIGGTGIPKSFQIAPVLCNATLRDIELKQEERNKIKNSALYKALQE